jgi:peptide/nickel transport system permease protein
MRFLLRRLGHGVLLLFGVSLLTFALAELAPGDYLDDLRLDPTISPETLEVMRERLGLDRSPVARYLYWIGSVARLELGYSYRTGRPVAELVGQAALNTFWLGGTATLLAWLVALPLGIWAAERRTRLASAVVGGGTSLLLAIPDVLMALLLLLVAVRTGWFPAGGMVSLGFEELSPGAKLVDLARHSFLPVMALVLTTLPVLFRHVHASFAEVLDSSFMRAVRGTGIPRGRRLLRYALPAAANPLISLVGLSIASLLSASILIEVVMSWPGIGPLLLDAVRKQDIYVVMAVVMASTGLLLVGNFLADVLLYLVDPRIRRETG